MMICLNQHFGQEPTYLFDQVMDLEYKEIKFTNQKDYNYDLFPDPTRLQKGHSVIVLIFKTKHKLDKIYEMIVKSGTIYIYNDDGKIIDTITA